MDKEGICRTIVIESSTELDSYALSPTAGGAVRLKSDHWTGTLASAA